jgi:hypothetical protein
MENQAASAEESAASWEDISELWDTFIAIDEQARKEGNMLCKSVSSLETTLREIEYTLFNTLYPLYSVVYEPFTHNPYMLPFLAELVDTAYSDKDICQDLVGLLPLYATYSMQQLNTLIHFSHPPYSTTAFICIFRHHFKKSFEVLKNIHACEYHAAVDQIRKLYTAGRGFSATDILLQIRKTPLLISLQMFEQMKTNKEPPLKWIARFHKLMNCYFTPEARALSLDINFPLSHPKCVPSSQPEKESYIPALPFSFIKSLKLPFIYSADIITDAVENKERHPSHAHPFAVDFLLYKSGHAETTNEGILYKAPGCFRFKSFTGAYFRYLNGMFSIIINKEGICTERAFHMDHQTKYRVPSKQLLPARTLCGALYLLSSLTFPTPSLNNSIEKYAFDETDSQGLPNTFTISFKRCS